MNRILIINIERNRHRREQLEKQLTAYHISNYDFIDAVDGDEMTDALIPLKIRRRKNVGKKFAGHFSNKEVACLRSHALAIDKAIEERLDYVIILEDDVILCEDWDYRLKKLFRLIPKKWNHVFLSGFPAGFDLVSNRGLFNPLNFAPFLHVERTNKTMGAFSYILRNEIFETVRDGYLSITKPTDNIVEDLIKSGVLRSYSFFPYLTYHDNDIKSEIWGTEYPVDHESKRYFLKKLP